MVDEEVLIFTSMMEVIREVATAIGDSVLVYMQPCLYEVVMCTKGTFSDTAKIAALGHLLDNKAQGFDFVLMAEDHRLL